MSDPHDTLGHRYGGGGAGGAAAVAGVAAMFGLYGGSQKAPKAPDYGPLARAQEKAAELQYQASQDYIKMAQQQFAEMKPLYEKDLAMKEKLTGKQTRALDQQYSFLQEKGQRSREQYGKFEKTIDMTNPDAWKRIGDQALSRLEKGLKDGTYTQGEFSFDAAAMDDDAGYQFRMQEGNKALNRQMAARGITGGAALKAAANYNQESASQEFANARNRALQNYQVEGQRRQGMFLRDNAMSQASQSHLMGIAGMRAQVAGQNDPTGGYSANAAGYGGAGQGYSAAIGALGNMQTGYLNRVGNANMQGAVAQGQGMLGAANAGIMGQQARIDNWAANQSNRQGWLNVGANIGTAMANVW